MTRVEALARKLGCDGRQDRRNHTTVSRSGGRDLPQVAQRARPAHRPRAGPLRALQGAAGSKPAQRQAGRPGQGGDAAAARARGGRAASAVDQQVQADIEQRVKEYAAGNADIAKGLVDIVRADTGFDPDHFLQGAKAAYEIIVTAFAEGNRKTLKDLLSPEVYEGFSGAITERESRGEQIDQSFVGIKSADLVEAELKSGIAQLTIKFVSELISATRDKAGGVINGDPKRIREVTDIWTFAREVVSRNPNWKLVATQAAN